MKTRHQQARPVDTEQLVPVPGNCRLVASRGNDDWVEQRPAGPTEPNSAGAHLRTVGTDRQFAGTDRSSTGTDRVLAQRQYPARRISVLIDAGVPPRCSSGGAFTTDDKHTGEVGCRSQAKHI